MECTKKEQKILKNLCKTYAPTAHFKLDTECYYNDEDCVIGYHFDQFCPTFIKHIKEKHHFPQIMQINENLFSLLHEIGHYYTFSCCLVTDEEEEIRTFYCDLPEETPSALVLNSTFMDIYYDLPLEWEATEWAIQFCKKHWDLVMHTSKILNEEEKQRRE